MWKHDDLTYGIEPYEEAPRSSHGEIECTEHVARLETAQDKVYIGEGIIATPLLRAQDESTETRVYNHSAKSLQLGDQLRKNQ